MALTKVTGGTISTTSDYQINNIVGVAGTFTTLNVSGVLTYEDVTNIESVGVATFKDDVEFHGTGAGISSVFWDKSANEFKFKDNIKLSFGDSRDLQLSHNGNDSLISHIGSATGALKILSGGAQSIECIKAGAVNIAHNGTTKLATTSTGAQIDTILILYGAAGNPGRLRLQEGGAISEIIGTRNSDANSDLQFKTERGDGTQVRAKINYSGDFVVPGNKVGIGTDNPSTGLQVDAGAVAVNTFLKTTSASSLIGFEHNAGSSYTTRIGSKTLGSGNVGLTFDTGTSGGSTKMTIDVNGNVGVNYADTNSWGAKFRVGGLLLSDQGSGNPYVFGKLSSAQDFVIARSDSSGNLTERFRIKSDGEIGINTTGYAGGGDDPQLYVFGAGGGRQVKIHNPTAGTSSIQLSNATTGQGNDNGFQLAQLSGGDFYFEHQLQAKDIVFRTKPSGGSVTERLRITSEGKFVMRSQGATASDGYAALEIRQNTGGKHLVLATNSATSSTNEVMLGFKLHPSGQDERVKAAIICRGTGTSDYGQPQFMSFCLDNVGDNGNATVANDEKVRITSGGQLHVGNATNNAINNALFKAVADDGEADNLYVGQFINKEATTGHSFGVNIQAGSSADDHGLRVKNRANDTTQFIVRGDGNVLIGTDSTGFAAYGDALTIYKANHVGLTLRTASNKDAAIYFADSSSGGGRYTGGINYNHSNNYMNFTVNETERLRITSDGQLIHKTNKSSGYIAEFHQEHADNPGTLLIDSPTDNNLRPSALHLSQAGTVKWVVGQVYSSNSDRAFHICSGTGEANSKLVVTTAGRIGIGTANPSAILDVDSGDALIGLWKSRRSSGSYIDYSLGANGAQLGFIGSGGQILTGGADSGDFAIRSQGDLCFASGGAAERGRFDSSGRFLLGVTSHSISSNEKFEVSGMSYFSNNSTSTGTIYVRNQQDNTSNVNSGAGAPFIIYTDGGGNRGGFFMNDSEQMGISSHGSLMFYQGNTAPANPTKPRGKLDTDGFAHVGFRTVWRRDHSISSSTATYTWDDVFHDINQAESSFMGNGAVYDIMMRSDNYRHFSLVYGTVIIGDIDNYGSSTNSWDWMITPTLNGVWTGGCGGQPISSVSNTSFNFAKGACSQSLTIALMRIDWPYNKGLLGTTYHQDT